MPTIHPSAIVSADAQLADDVTVGPFAIIDAGASIGAGCQIRPQAWITGNAILGESNHVGYGAIIGDNPQDTSFDPNTPSHVVIGDNNRIGDYATIHRSTFSGGSTTIGNDNFIMIGVHVGHDVQIGNRNVLANNVLLGGHIKIGNHIFLGAGAGFHQFIHIGDYSITQGNAAVSRDVPPYCVVHGQNALSGLNVIGLRRGGFSAEDRADIKRAYNRLFRSGGNLKQALALADDEQWSAAAHQLLSAARSPSRKGLMSR